MPTLAAGVLEAANKRLYTVPNGFDAELYVTYSNPDASTPTSANLFNDAAGFAAVRRIGKNTVIPAAGRVEIPGDGSPICLGEGDSLTGDSAAAVDYIVSGREIRKR